jgi:hypothetical protein
MLNNLRIIAQGTLGSFYHDIIDKIACCGDGVANYLCDQDLLIVEVEPQIRTIRWTEEIGTVHTHQWQLPYLQFLFFAEMLGLAASKAPYTMGSPFYLAPLPNIYEDGRVCQGFSKTFESALVKFYSSRFTCPMAWDSCIRFKRATYSSGPPTFFPYEKLKDVEFADRWQELSLSDDPLAMFDFNWEEMGRLEKYRRGWPPSSGLGSLGSVEEFIMAAANHIKLFGYWQEEKRERYYELNAS